MNNKIQIFNNPEFGEFHFIEIDGEIYMIGTEVAKALGYKDPYKALKQHVDTDDWVKCPLTDNLGRIQQTKIITESGFYSLVLASKLEGAKKFKKWVTSEVLPTIRKTGSYNANPPRIEEKSTVHIENLNITNNYYIEDKPTRKTSKNYNNKKGDYMTKYEIEQLRYNLEDYLQRMDIDTHKSMMSCPICGDSDGFHLLPYSNKQYWKCFSAKHSTYPRDNGDIFELVAQMENITYLEAIKKVSKMYSLNSFKDIPKFKPIHTDETSKEQKDRTSFYNMALKYQNKTIEYLSKVRGYVHAKEIAQHYQIGYSPEYAYEFENNNPSKTTPAVIIPTTQYSYSWRSTTEPLKKKSGKVVPFNMECLQDISKKWIFLVEGEFDCMSILDIALDVLNSDFSAISVNSANNLPRFMEEYICKNIQQGVGLIIALDNDTNEQTNQAVRKYEQLGLQIAMMYEIPCIVSDTKALYLSQKDGNDALRHNRQAFFKAIQQEIYKAKALDITQYMAQCADLINQPKEPSKSYVSTYDFDYIGEIDRAFDIGNNYLRYCHQNKTRYIYNGIKLQQDTTICVVMLKW